MVEKDFETLRINCDIREFTANLMNIIGIIYTDQLQTVGEHTVVSKHPHAGFFEKGYHLVQANIALMIADR